MERSTSTQYPWQSTRRFHDFATDIKIQFGSRVQKLSINAGFTCPNRDGTKDHRGCAFCNNTSFRPNYCEPEKSITQQLEEGIQFFSKKYPEMRFFAYFQSYSNTYESLDVLEKVYSEALAHERVIGLVIGTRPDCVNDEILQLIADIGQGHYVALEYGVESTNDDTLSRINRHHAFKEAQNAILKTQGYGIQCGIHLILGLPGEDNEQMMQHAQRINELPIDSLKLHQLQIVKNTLFAHEFQHSPQQFPLFSLEEYLDFLVDFLEVLSPEIAIERFVNQVPFDLLIAPKWGIKNFEFVARLESRLRERDTWQGRLYKGKTATAEV